MTHNPDDPNVRAFQALMQAAFGGAPPASRFAALRSWLAQLERQLDDLQLLIRDIRAELDALDNLP